MIFTARALTWAGIVLWAVGLATLVYGVANLSPSVEGAYFDQSFRGPTGAFGTAVTGEGRIVAGIVLVTLGGVALIVAALRRD